MFYTDVCNPLGVNFLKGVRSVSRFSFWLWMPVVPAPFVEKTVIVLLYYL